MSSNDEKKNNLLNSLKGLDSNQDLKGGFNPMAFNSDTPITKDGNNLSSKLGLGNQKNEVDRKQAFDPKGKNKQVLKGNSKSMRR